MKQPNIHRVLMPGLEHNIRQQSNICETAIPGFNDNGIDLMIYRPCPVWRTRLNTIINHSHWAINNTGMAWFELVVMPGSNDTHMTIRHQNLMTTTRDVKYAYVAGIKKTHSNTNNIGIPLWCFFHVYFGHRWWCISGITRLGQLGIWCLSFCNIIYFSTWLHLTIHT